LWSLLATSFYHILFSMLLPWSKSLTNRNLILAALSQGITTLSGVLYSDDTHYMMQALRDLWYTVDDDKNWTVRVHGWLDKLQHHDLDSTLTLFLWNSGTSMRFLTWFVSLRHTWGVTLTWTERMQQRPLEDLLDWIKQLGVDVESQDWFPPITIKRWITIDYTQVISLKWDVSSQYFTALLQIAPCLPHWLTINVIGELVSKPYIAMTINEMAKFGVTVQNNEYRSFVVQSQVYRSVDGHIEWDASALSYIALWVLLHARSLTINNIWSDSCQGDYLFLDMLLPFGLEYISNGSTTKLIGEWWSYIKQLASKDRVVDFESMPDVSLTYMVLAPLLPWTTTLIWLQTLNLKESERIEAMATELRKLWVVVETTTDSMIIQHCDARPQSWSNIKIETYDDHRIAMSFGILNTIVNCMDIQDPDCVAKTYPKFWEDIRMLLD